MTDIQDTPEINWGYNCLTIGIHHGRPEALWNLPLLQALTMFETAGLQKIVIARIYNDAMAMVEHGAEPRMPKEWAEKVRDLAEDKFFILLATKMNEVQQYYLSSAWRNDIEFVISRIENNKLNTNYQPLHSHDSLNMLCRILGTQCSREAAQEFAA